MVIALDIMSRGIIFGGRVAVVAMIGGRDNGGNIILWLLIFAAFFIAYYYRVVNALFEPQA